MSRLHTQGVLHELLQLTVQLTEAAAVVVGRRVGQLQSRNNRIQLGQVRLNL